jgi:hypothetical protein
MASSDGKPTPKGAPNLTPKFLRANIAVSIEGAEGNYPSQFVSESGVYGLRWPPFVPAKHFGKVALVKVALRAGSESFSFEVPASVMRESALRSERMSLAFRYPDPEVRQWVRRLVEEYGHAPHEYTRRYPRIPSKLIPPEAKLHAGGGGATVGLSRESRWIPFEVLNLSPEGVLVQSTETDAASLRPGDFMNLELHFRKEDGSPGLASMKTRVFRVSEELIEGAVVRRSLGLHFAKVDASTRKTYFNLLERVLRSLARPA